MNDVFSPNKHDRSVAQQPVLCGQSWMMNYPRPRGYVKGNNHMLARRLKINQGILTLKLTVVTWRRSIMVLRLSRKQKVLGSIPSVAFCILFFNTGFFKISGRSSSKMNCPWKRGGGNRHHFKKSGMRFRISGKSGLFFV